MTGNRRCGVERWAVKTLSDSAARRVSFTPRPATVRGLRRVRPTGTFVGERNKPIELRTYRVRARLVEIKLEDDSDVHLVIADPKTGGTMIVEFPAHACTTGATRAARTKMRKARAALVRSCGAAPTGSFRPLMGVARITGVGFFDVLHGQRGVAPNGIELHPVIGFTGGCS